MIKKEYYKDNETWIIILHSLILNNNNELLAMKDEKISILLFLYFPFPAS